MLTVPTAVWGTCLHLFGDVIYTSVITNQSLSGWLGVRGDQKFQVIFSSALCLTLPKFGWWFAQCLREMLQTLQKSWSETCGMGPIWSQVPAYTWAKTCPSPERQGRETNTSAGLSFILPDFWLLQCKYLHLSLFPGPLLRVNEEKWVPFWVWFIWPISPACLGLWDEQSPCRSLGVSSLILKQAQGCLAQFYTLDLQNQVREFQPPSVSSSHSSREDEQPRVVCNLPLPFLTEDCQQKKRQDGQTLLMSFCPINVSRDQIPPFFSPPLPLTLVQGYGPSELLTPQQSPSFTGREKKEFCVFPSPLCSWLWGKPQLLKPPAQGAAFSNSVPLTSWPCSRGIARGAPEQSLICSYHSKPEISHPETLCQPVISTPRSVQSHEFCSANTALLHQRFHTEKL